MTANRHPLTFDGKIVTNIGGGKTQYPNGHGGYYRAYAVYFEGAEAPVLIPAAKFNTQARCSACGRKAQTCRC